MTSKVLLHKVPPVSKQRSYLPLNALQASFLSWDTAQPSRKLQPAQGASFTTGQRVTRHVTASDSTTEPPLVLATPSGTSNSLLIRPQEPPTDRNHSPVRSPVRCRTYAAVAPCLGVWPRSRTSSCCCCCCCCASSCRRAAAGGRAADGGWAAKLGGGDFGCSSLSHVLISHLKLSCQLSKAQA